MDNLLTILFHVLGVVEITLADECFSSYHGHCERITHGCPQGFHSKINVCSSGEVCCHKFRLLHTSVGNDQGGQALSKQQQSDACKNVHCYNGVCHVTGNTFECICDPWFTGKFCERVNLAYKPSETTLSQTTTSATKHQFICQDHYLVNCNQKTCSDVVWISMCPATCGLCNPSDLSTTTLQTIVSSPAAILLTSNHNQQCYENPFVKCNDQSVCRHSTMAQFCPVACGMCSIQPTTPVKITASVSLTCMDSKLIQCNTPNICTASVGRYCRRTCGKCGLAKQTDTTTQGITTNWWLIGHLSSTTTTSWLHIPKGRRDNSVYQVT